ncbi:MAG: MaoC family dehydratase N-terminal domain-containing protein [Neisseriaceae bacterium]|nr:MaoC family dehydratase N-terminal domain-containing protein [Neisseriaceae bacterium]
MTSRPDDLSPPQTTVDVIDPVRVRRLAVTLGQDVPTVGQDLPWLWHWAFFQAERPAAELGQDGHPEADGFVPVPYGLRRMWAGGRFEFFSPLVIGATVQRQSHLGAITEKQGAGGTLRFVTLTHQYWQSDTLALVEHQDLVYRGPGPTKRQTPMPSRLPQWQHVAHPDSTLLFRYSAVTFNGHRIHYDYPYATATEGYPNLVVHGPLMATWALQAFTQAHPHKTITHYRYRGLRPSCLPDAITVCGCLSAPQQAEVWLHNQAGLIQQGQITYADPSLSKDAPC